MGSEKPKEHNNRPENWQPVTNRSDRRQAPLVGGDQAPDLSNLYSGHRRKRIVSPNNTLIVLGLLASALILLAMFFYTPGE